ncbi:MAG: sel1 repeat family protein [Proteobacteria bacterium]|nr:sel1 repeat family protein [Pseudomonadota bacterium]
MRFLNLFPVICFCSAMLLSRGGAISAAESQKLLKDTPFEEIVAKAKAGDADTQIYLAKGHASILGGGVPHNLQESHKWYVAAATNNGPEAQFYLGKHYYDEVVSTRGNAPKDKAKRQQIAPLALTWMMKAARQEYGSAWVFLGNAFDEGTVFAKDPVEAYKWYHLAAC